MVIALRRSWWKQPRRGGWSSALRSETSSASRDLRNSRVEIGGTSDGLAGSTLSGGFFGVVRFILVAPFVYIVRTSYLWRAILIPPNGRRRPDRQNIDRSPFATVLPRNVGEAVLQKGSNPVWALSPPMPFSDRPFLATKAGVRRAKSGRAAAAPLVRAPMDRSRRTTHLEMDSRIGWAVKPDDLVSALSQATSWFGSGPSRASEKSIWLDTRLTPDHEGDVGIAELGFLRDLVEMRLVWKLPMVLPG